MTEVPDHLLKRSRDRRAALGLGGGDGGDDGGAATSAVAPAADASTSVAATAARPAVVAEVAAAPPKPVPAFVQASLNRKKIPLWVMPVLAFLPLWAIVYVNTLSKAPSKAPTQLEAGATLYAAKCQGCHQADGSGGAGRPLNQGSVVKTFPNIAQQLQFVWLGSTGTGASGTPYGDPNREGGGHKTLSYNGNPMPTFKGGVTQTELLEIVRHEREVFGAEKIPASQIAPDGSLLWANGKPMLNAAGELVDPDGKALFDADGKLANPAQFTAPAK
ncbi:MAG TPA: c-type cytochrome [Acidimicrobiales bacterium]